MNDKLNDALNEISDKHLIEAETYQKRRFPYWFTAAAALLALAILLGFAIGSNPAVPDTSNPLLEHTRPSNSLPSYTYPPIAPKPSGILPPDNPLFVNLAAAPVYPKMVQCPDLKNFANEQDYYAAERDFLAAQSAQYDQPDGYADSLKDFFSASIAQFLQGEGNTAYSPLNVYMAMAMLAETTDGNSRQQILDLFGVNSIEQLRTQAGHVWNAHFSDDGRTTLLMANSLWLDDLFDYHQYVADRLALWYYASTFHGDLGTEALNLQLREWLNANTGGLLKEQADNVELNPSTVFALASTIYFSADWADEFSEENTCDKTFHTPTGDIQTPFMHQTRRDIYYRGTNFGAIYLALSGSNRMWLILPDEGFTTEDILKSDEYLQLTLDPQNWPNDKTYSYKIHLSLPKFDVVQQQNMIDGMKNLGITDIFDNSISNFTPITSTSNLSISKIDHAVRVTIDEKGCIAAAFTVIISDGAGVPAVEELYFTLDRPFLFLVTSRDHLPLFAGVVNEP